MLSAGGLRGVSHPHLHPLPSRERDAYMEVQEGTSCRGFGGVPQFNSPPKSRGQGVETLPELTEASMVARATPAEPEVEPRERKDELKELKHE